MAKKAKPGSGFQIASGRSIKVGAGLYRRGEEAELIEALNGLEPAESKSLFAFYIREGVLADMAAPDPGSIEGLNDGVEVPIGSSPAGSLEGSGSMAGGDGEEPAEV